MFKKGSKMECQFPTVNSTTNEIKEILQNTKTIAIVGLSPDTSKDSHKVGKYLQNVGYKVIPIYPKEDEILGEKVYRSLSEVKENIDLVDIFRKSEVVSKIVDEAIARGDVKVIWTQLGVVNNEASEKAKEAGMRVVQNHCTKIEHQMLKEGIN